MKKTFTQKVPDELYLNSFDNEKEITLEYDGPEVILVETNKSGVVIGMVEEKPTYIQTNNINVIECDAEKWTAAAYWLLQAKDGNYKYEYHTIINHDGSEYTEIANPKLTDYYQLVYNEGSSELWEFEVIERQKLSVSEIKTIENLQKLEESFSDVALTEEFQVIYDTFIKDANEYLESMKDILPWRYVEIKSPVPPKIPLELLKLMVDINPQP